MYRICINKITGEVIPDFQALATKGTLIKNAVKAGLGPEENFEEKLVDEEEYKSEVNKFIDKTKQEKLQEETRIKNKKKALKQKIKASLSLDDEELTMLIGD